jgi:hypothetical protein
MAERGGDRECWSQYGRHTLSWRQTSLSAHTSPHTAGAAAYPPQFEFTGQGPPRRITRVQYGAPPSAPCPQSPVSSSAYGSFHDPGRVALPDPTRAVSASGGARSAPAAPPYAGKQASMFGLVAVEAGRG